MVATSMCQEVLSHNKLMKIRPSCFLCIRECVHQPCLLLYQHHLGEYQASQGQHLRFDVVIIHLPSSLLLLMRMALSIGRLSTSHGRLPHMEALNRQTTILTPRPLGAAQVKKMSFLHQQRVYTRNIIISCNLFRKQCRYQKRETQLVSRSLGQEEEATTLGTQFVPILGHLSRIRASRKIRAC